MSNIFIWLKNDLFGCFRERRPWQKQCNRFERGRRNRNVNYSAPFACRTYVCIQHFVWDSKNASLESFSRCIVCDRCHVQSHRNPTLALVRFCWVRFPSPNVRLVHNEVSYCCNDGTIPYKTKPMHLGRNYLLHDKISWKATQEQCSCNRKRIVWSS